MGAAASEATSGNRVMKRRKYGITVATWVCCNITSETQTR
jgi:hypothetical protein